MIKKVTMAPPLLFSPYIARFSYFQMKFNDLQDDSRLCSNKYQIYKIFNPSLFSNPNFKALFFTLRKFCLNDLNEKLSMLVALCQLT